MTSRTSYCYRTSSEPLEHCSSNRSAIEDGATEFGKGGIEIKTLTPFLWFNDSAEAAAEFYTSVFEGSRVTGVSRYTEAGPGREGTVMLVTLELAGHELMLLNGGPEYHFTEAISLMVTCETQEEIDDLWERLTAEGEEGPCGWLKDKFGVSWQIAPRVLLTMQQDKDAERVDRVMRAMFRMTKLDVKELERAYAVSRS